MLTTLLIVLVVICIVGGIGGYNQVGPLAYSPVGVLLLVLLILFLTGNLH